MDKIDEVLTRGVDKIYPSRTALEKLLRSGKKIRLYQGFDPTGEKLHIGHLIGLLKLHQFQDLGHEVIFLIGDGTGLSGDPSGKTNQRKRFLTRQELKNNARSYVQQAERIVNFKGKNPARILFNGDWLTALKLEELLDLFGRFTTAQLLERDIFQKRISKGKPVNLREFIYPILQGYDSVAMKVDLEIGGTDQTFNMLTGRNLVKQILGKEKYVLTLPLLADSGGRKIGKTEGNTIAIKQNPNNLYGQIMNLPDDVIINCLYCITDLPLTDVEKMETDLKNGKNPMLLKKKLAFSIVKMLNSEKEAVSAQKYFETVFQKKETNANIPEIKITNEKIGIIDLMIKLSVTGSRSQAKRLINEKAVDIDGRTVTSVNLKLKPVNGLLLKVGKYKIIKLKVN